MSRRGGFHQGPPQQGEWNYYGEQPPQQQQHQQQQYPITQGIQQQHPGPQGIPHQHPGVQAIPLQHPGVQRYPSQPVRGVPNQSFPSGNDFAGARQAGFLQQQQPVGRPQGMPYQQLDGPGFVGSNAGPGSQYSQFANNSAPQYQQGMGAADQFAPQGDHRAGATRLVHDQRLPFPDSYANNSASFRQDARAAHVAPMFTETRFQQQQMQPEHGHMYGTPQAQRQNVDGHYGPPGVNAAAGDTKYGPGFAGAGIPQQSQQHYDGGGLNGSAGFRGYADGNQFQPNSAPPQQQRAYVPNDIRPMGRAEPMPSGDPYTHRMAPAGGQQLVPGAGLNPQFPQMQQFSAQQQQQYPSQGSYMAPSGEGKPSAYDTLRQSSNARKDSFSSQGLTSYIASAALSTDTRLYFPNDSTRPIIAPAVSLLSRPVARRSRSPPTRRQRSKSPPTEYKKRHRESSRWDEKPKGVRSRSPSPVAKVETKVLIRKVDFSMSRRQLSSLFNTPVIPFKISSLSAQDLNHAFPRLYIPADFIKIDIDFASCRSATRMDGPVQNMHRPIDFVLESNPLPLKTPVSEKSPPSSQLEALLPDGRNCPIKFNCRVIFSFGVATEASANESVLTVDHTLPRKLRFLCGRRKGSVALLGGTWSQELDGGNPLVDRSCLINTAIRSVRASAFCDLGRCAAFYRLFDVSYHRPEETYDGKLYPELEEVTTVFLCNLSNPNYSTEEFQAEWKLFIRRADGEGCGTDQPGSTKDSENSTNGEALLEQNGDGEVKVNVEEAPETPQDPSKEPGEITADPDEVEASARVPVVRVCPANPALLLCPQPVFVEKSGETDKKYEAASIRVLTLNSMLAYSLEDRNERLFEVSFTAEVIVNLMAQAHALVLVDCLLAASDSLSALADERIRSAVGILLCLRELRQDFPVAAPEVAPAADTGTSTVQVPEVAPSATETGLAATSSMDHVLTKSESDMILSIAGNEGLEMNEDVLFVRSRFLDACRWFDVNNEKALHIEHIRLIFSSVDKHLSRTDITSLLEALMAKQGDKGDRILLYEKMFS